MNIGITYDLKSEYLAQGFNKEQVAEFDDLETIESIEKALVFLGHKTDRIGNIKALVSKLSGGDRWDLVFNIAEGIKGDTREAQVPALLDAYGIPYTFSSPDALFHVHNKIRAKTLAVSCSVPTPHFWEITKPANCFYLYGPFYQSLFMKPVSEGSSKGIDIGSKIDNGMIFDESLRDILAKYDQNVLLEEYLPGREFTVGIIGTGDWAFIIGIMEIILKDGAEKVGYTYYNKQNYKNTVEYRLVIDKEAQRAGRDALKVWKLSGCRDVGRVDMRSDSNGVPNFLEINALPGLNPIYSDLPILCYLAGMSYFDLISKIIESAKERL